MGGHRKKKNQKKNFSKKKKRDKNFHFCLFRQGKRNAVEPCFFFRTLGAGNGAPSKRSKRGQAICNMRCVGGSSRRGDAGDPRERRREKQSRRKCTDAGCVGEAVLGVGVM